MKIDDYISYEGPVATITYQLPRDRTELVEVLLGYRWSMVVWDMYELLRRPALKGEHSFENADDALEWVWRGLHESCADRGIDIDLEDPYRLKVKSPDTGDFADEVADFGDGS